MHGSWRMQRKWRVRQKTPLHPWAGPKTHLNMHATLALHAVLDVNHGRPCMCRVYQMKQSDRCFKFWTNQQYKISNNACCILDCSIYSNATLRYMKGGQMQIWQLSGPRHRVTWELYKVVMPPPCPALLSYILVSHSCLALFLLWWSAGKQAGTAVGAADQPPQVECNACGVWDNLDDIGVSKLTFSPLLEQPELTTRHVMYIIQQIAVRTCYGITVSFSKAAYRSNLYVSWK